MMKKKLVIMGLATMTALPVLANEGDWLVRARIINVAPSESSTLNLGVSSDTVPELDFSYFVAKNIALELILATSRHEVTLPGTGSLGNVSALPPTVTVQYHFSPEGTVRPYVGAGINYTRFYRDDLKLGAQSLTIDKNSWGGALQAGLDFALSKNSFVNLDVKKIYMKTDVSLNGAKIDTLKINPVVWGIGYGMKF